MIGPQSVFIHRFILVVRFKKCEFMKEIGWNSGIVTQPTIYQFILDLGLSLTDGRELSAHLQSQLFVSSDNFKRQINEPERWSWFKVSMNGLNNSFQSRLTSIICVLTFSFKLTLSKFS